MMVLQLIATTVRITLTARIAFHSTSLSVATSMQLRVFQQLLA